MIKKIFFYISSPLDRRDVERFGFEILQQNGFDVEEFNEIPSVLENEADFVGAAKEMTEYVGSFI